MQFSVVALLSLAALALGSPASSKAGLKSRQQAGAGAGAGGAAGGQPTVQQPAMTDQNGNVVNFDSANVYLAGQDAGL
ncbi:hypothetical protein VUR80DRAFT_4961 [Thermomyces stellatus]